MRLPVVASGGQTFQKDLDGDNAPLASSSFSDPGTSTLPITQHHRWLDCLFVLWASLRGICRVQAIKLIHAAMCACLCGMQLSAPPR
jgi:hypothetical protein